MSAREFKEKMNRRLLRRGDGQSTLALFLRVTSCPLWLRILNHEAHKGKRRKALRYVFLLPLVTIPLLVSSSLCAVDPTVDGLKAKLSSTSVGDRPKLCLQIAEMQMAETTKLYAASEDEQAKPTLTDVVTYSELARDYAIQSNKHQKQTEIAVRGMTRKLNEILHTLGHEEQGPVKDALSHLQRVRDDLLAAMFKKGAK
jgi:hypothetical protein